MSKEDSGSGEPASSDVDEALGYLVGKIHRKNKAKSAKQLHQVLSQKRALEDRLRVVEERHNSLSATVERQMTKLTGYESKAGRFRTFIDGLGNDLNAVKKDYFAQKQISEQLAGELETRKGTQDALLAQVNACCEKSTQLKSEALKAFRKATESLAAKDVRILHLEQQLEDRTRRLVEDREIRLQLAGQMNNVDAANQTLTNNLKRSTESIMDKLFEMHAGLEESNGNGATIEVLENIATAMHGSNTQQAATTEEVASVKVLTEGISDR